MTTPTETSPLSQHLTLTSGSVGTSVYAVDSYQSYYYGIMIPPLAYTPPGSVPR